MKGQEQLRPAIGFKSYFCLSTQQSPVYSNQKSKNLFAWTIFPLYFRVDVRLVKGRSLDNRPTGRCKKVALTLKGIPFLLEQGAL